MLPVSAAAHTLQLPLYTGQGKASVDFSKSKATGLEKKWKRLSGGIWQNQGYLRLTR
jgi:hypothetical protein